MPYQERTSKAIKQARLRISGMQALDLPLDMGNGLSIPAYAATIQDTEQKIKAYNTAVAAISQLSSAAEQAEKDLSDLSERMLSIVAGRYGRKSDEYETAGGTKRTNRRRATPKKTEMPTEALANA
jgi:hypothetical protein